MFNLGTVRFAGIRQSDLGTHTFIIKFVVPENQEESLWFIGTTANEPQPQDAFYLWELSRCHLPCS